MRTGTVEVFTTWQHHEGHWLKDYQCVRGRDLVVRAVEHGYGDSLTTAEYVGFSRHRLFTPKETPLTRS